MLDHVFNEHKAGFDIPNHFGNIKVTYYIPPDLWSAGKYTETRLRKYRPYYSEIPLTYGRDISRDRHDGYKIRGRYDRVGKLYIMVN